MHSCCTGELLFLLLSEERGTCSITRAPSSQFLSSTCVIRYELVWTGLKKIIGYWLTWRAALNLVVTTEPTRVTGIVPGATSGSRSSQASTFPPHYPDAFFGFNCRLIKRAISDEEQSDRTMRTCTAVLLGLLLLAVFLFGVFLLAPFPILLFPAIIKTQVYLR